MATKICFWNTEHLSPNALTRARNAADRLAAMQRGAQEQEARTASRPHRPLTRYFMANHDDDGSDNDSDDNNADTHKRRRLDRDTSNAIARQRQLDKADRLAARLRNKANLAISLRHSARHVFFCEVLTDYADSFSSLDGIGPVPHETLCYAHFLNGTRDVLPSAHGLGWCDPPTYGERVPKGIIIQTARREDVRFCFWHAPSGNDGNVVANMYASMLGHAAGAPVVLFGDLNAEPGDVAGKAGVTMAEILAPVGATRISGRKLDYAITNRPDLFRGPPYGLRNAEGYDIKQQVGSDHMVMFFYLK